MNAAAAVSSRLAALFAITRFWNCVAASFAVLVGVYLGGGTAALGSIAAAAAAVTVALTVGVANIANDLFDVEVDRVQKAWRPLPAARLTRRGATAAATVLALAALGLALTLGSALAILVAFAGAAGVAYSAFLKGTVLAGNVVVAALSATVLLFGSLVAGRVTAAAGFAAVMVFWFMLGREILKDVADRPGDDAAGVATLATRLGPGASLRIAGVALAVYAATSVLPWLAGMASATYLIAIAVLALGPTGVVMVRLSLRPTDANLASALFVTKLAWFGGLGAMVLLR